MEPAAERTYTPEEYLAFERASEMRHEYVDGEVFAMTGASREHNLIVVNIGSELRGQLKGRPCEAYVAEMRVRVSPTAYLYPDVVVVCGEARFEDEAVDTLLNPTLLVEVLSESTEAYDRGKKFERYRQIGSLAEYVSVAQDRPHIEQFTRQSDGGWLLVESDGRDATVRLASIDATLALAEVFDKVDA